jgi:shikimate kinase
VRKSSIVLIGMAGSGKSTIGASLARALGFNFTDLDEYILKTDGRTIQSIIDTEGEEALLRVEEQRMAELDLKSSVIAPGGSLIYNTHLMESLKKQALIVFLNESFENIKMRLKNAQSRGIVGLKRKSLREIYDERWPLYSRYADITINSSGKSPDKVVKEIVDRYRAEY